eukprot:Nitzschia sp. Nitz4//scaffold66_size103028//54223//54713//NITZ4_004501-RA/size103028-augustus-gene-0.78-mRNA-1//-1//CDS//3329556359//5237//frame0
MLHFSWCDTGGLQHSSLPFISPTASSTRMHSCQVQVTFPTNIQAQQVLSALQVDEEPTNRVSKSFRLETVQKGGQKVHSMVVQIESKELKMLRVGVSSLYDYLLVALKTLQEFDETTLDLAM